VDPLAPRKGKACFKEAWHSVGAGASLLSATGVGIEWNCASELVWASGLWLRWLWGMERLVDTGMEVGGMETGLDVSGNSTTAMKEVETGRPIRVLYLSRAKQDTYAMHHSSFSAWQASRHITNEPALLSHLRSTLSSLCSGLLSHRCKYTDANISPALWTLDHALPSSSSLKTPLQPIRFATMDPTTVTLPSQIRMMGHTDVVISVHAGALGLCLFMPTGRAAVVEIISPGADGNEHFHNLAAMLGMQYERVKTELNVDVNAVGNAVKKLVIERLDHK